MNSNFAILLAILSLLLLLRSTNLGSTLLWRSQQIS